MRAAAAAIACALALASCGRASTPQPVSAGAPGAPAPAPAPAPSGPTLPTLPPVQQRNPELFDERGCERLGQGQVSCASTAGQLDAAAAQESPDGTRTLAGFVGKHWSTAPPTGAVAVLESTITTGPSDTGPWQASGLLRNEQAGVIPVATVQAELLGNDGSVLETVRGDALVHTIRSGEPAPFSIVARQATPGAVVSVRWSAAAASSATPTATASTSTTVVPSPAPGSSTVPSSVTATTSTSAPETTVTLAKESSSVSADPAQRLVELHTFWTRTTGDARRIDNPLHRDPPSGPLPLALSGSVTNQGTAPIARPEVVLAWLDANGRVVIVREVEAALSTGEPAPELAPGSAADFLASVDAGAAVAIPADLQATPMLWGGAA